MITCSDVRSPSVWEVTVTTWGTYQSDGAKVSVRGETDTAFQSHV